MRLQRLKKERITEAVRILAIFKEEDVEKVGCTWLTPRGRGGWSFLKEKYVTICTICVQITLRRLLSLCYPNNQKLPPGYLAHLNPRFLSERCVYQAWIAGHDPAD